jgi:hypothetical protein
MAEIQMPPHVQAAYKDAVDNVIFHNRQQWVATNYALLIYAAIFVISARFFSRTDVARGWLGFLVVLTFVYNLVTIYLLQDRVTRFRARLDWIYNTYFSRDEQAGLKLWPEPKPFLYEWIVPVGLVAVSLIAATLTMIYLFSVRWRLSAMRSTILAYVIALAGLVMIAAGAWDLFTKGTASARLRHYAIAIGMICGGLAIGGLAQALRLLLEINAKGG